MRNPTANSHQSGAAPRWKFGYTVPPSRLRAFAFALSASLRQRGTMQFRAFTLIAISLIAHAVFCPGASCAPDATVPETQVRTVKPHAAAEPHSPRAEAQDVIDTLQNLIKAYSKGDIDEYQKHLDHECTVFDEEKNKMVEGKDAVVASLRARFAKHAAGGSEPLISYTIDQPYVKVTGNMAVVTYRAVQEIGGKSPGKAEALMTDVFIKDDGDWKKVHERGTWRRVK